MPPCPTRCRSSPRPSLSTSGIPNSFTPADRPMKNCACWSRLDEFARHAAERFPLAPAECADLRAELNRRVAAIHKAEVAAHSRLGEIVRNIH